MRVCKYREQGKGEQQLKEEGEWAVKKDMPFIREVNGLKDESGTELRGSCDKRQDPPNA